MKRILVLLLALSCLLLAGCGRVWSDLKQISSDLGSMGRPAEATETAPATQAPTLPSHTETVPFALAQTDDGFEPEYTPQLLLRQGGVCDLTVNMAEYMVQATGSYAVLAFDDGSRVIHCVYNPEEIDGYQRMQNGFFLVELEPGVWSFFGEGIGLTWSGCRFYPVGSDTLTVDTQVMPSATPKNDLYSDASGQGSTLRITAATKDTVSFDVKWPHLTGLTGATAYIRGSYGFFVYELEEEGIQKDWTAGYVEFVDGQTLKLVIFDSALPHLDAGSNTYQLVPAPETPNS